jgi:hypothetical protein
MAKFKFIKNVVLNGQVRSAGDVIDESDLTSLQVKQFLYFGKVVPHDEVEIKTASVEVQHRDPQPKKKRGRARKGD